jgi:hypothetical protein
MKPSIAEKSFLWRQNIQKIVDISVNTNKDFSAIAHSTQPTGPVSARRELVQFGG